MTDIQNTIDNLKDAVPCLDDFNLPIGFEEAVEQAIQILSSLQPSGNEELVEILDDLKGQLMHPHDRHNIQKAITALSAPKTFDVLEHLRGGGEVQCSVYGYRFKRDGENGTVKQKTIITGEWVACLETDSDFLTAFMHGTLKPYTPPEPELEDGFAWFKKPLQNDYMAVFQVKDGKICHANGTSEISDPHHWEFVEMIEAPEVTGNE